MGKLLNSKRDSSAVAIVNLFSELTTVFRGARTLSESDAAKSVAMEGIDADLSDNVRQSLASRTGDLERALKSSFKGIEITAAMEEAALQGVLTGEAAFNYIRGGDRYSRAALSRFEGIRDGAANVVIDGVQSVPRDIAFEAYDNRVNNNLVAFNVAYNANGSRQLEAAELFYPTVVIAANQFGFVVNNRIVYSFDAVLRAATGALSTFNRKNIIKALIDASILATDQTKIIPVYRNGSGGTADSRPYFSSGVGTKTIVTADGDTVVTAPLAVGKAFDLIGISQTNTQLAAGVADQTDSLDTLKVVTIYVKLTDGTTTSYIPFDVTSLPTSDFNAAVQGNTRKLQLNFESLILPLASTTVDVSGSVVSLLSTLGTNTARIKVTLNASVLQDKGDFDSSASALRLVTLTDSSANPLDITGTLGASITTLLGTSNVDSFDVYGYKSNANRRQRGKLLDFQNVNYLYTVPLLPPLAMARPMMNDDSNDGQMLADLVGATRSQTSNAFVTEVLKVLTVMSTYAASADTRVISPNLFGAASDLVTPSYRSSSLDVAATIDSRTTSERIHDLKTLIINKIRAMAFDMYVESGYGPALEAMYPGQGLKPIVIAVTDPVIANYLQITGDDRLVGDLFDFQIKPVFDSRMAGKLIFSFGIKEALGSGVPTVLHFGNLAWRSELTAILPQTRNNTQSMELTVQPSYRHVTHLPIVGVITVTNLASVVASKVSVNMHSV